MTKKNSYKIDGFQRAKQELEILEARSYARIEDMIPQLISLGLKPNMNVLEVGSGTGTRSLKIAQFLKKGKMMGIDVSDKLLAHAQMRSKQANVKNLTLEKMDIYDLKLPKASFDFVYLRLVVQHLSHPVLALKNLRSVLKPGGILFIEDTDRDWLTIHPSTPQWLSTYEQVKNAQTRQGGDPRSGRKLATYLREAGFKSVEMKLIPVWGTGLVFEDWIDNYAPSFFNYFDKSAQKKGLKVLSDLKKRSTKKAHYFQQVWFQAWGKK